MNVRSIGVQEHKRPDHVYLYTMTEEHETGANHIVEAVQWLFIDRVTSSPVPPKLFVQLYNGTRDTKLGTSSNTWRALFRGMCSKRFKAYL